jgi:hypothetical protein
MVGFADSAHPTKRERSFYREGAKTRRKRREEGMDMVKANHKLVSAWGRYGGLRGLSPPCEEGEVLLQRFQAGGRCLIDTTKSTKRDA